MDLSELRLALIDERAYLELDQRRVHVEKSSIEPNLYRITTLSLMCFFYKKNTKSGILDISELRNPILMIFGEKL